MNADVIARSSTTNHIVKLSCKVEGAVPSVIVIGY